MLVYSLQTDKEGDFFTTTVRRTATLMAKRMSERLSTTVYVTIIGGDETGDIDIASYTNGIKN